MFIYTSIPFMWNWEGETLGIISIVEQKIIYFEAYLILIWAYSSVILYRKQNTLMRQDFFYSLGFYYVHTL